jgi:hypothetical protein
MKRICLILSFFLITIGSVLGQWSGYTTDQGSELDGGIGMTWIDDQAYYTISFQPDISIGKLGFGLGLNLLYNTETGKIRTEDWDSNYDYARIIRYIRYGHKGDTFYTRVGALDAARLGHGFILNYYNNQVNYDERKIGLTLDIDFGKYGFESLTSNLGRLELIGGRAYYRPLYSSPVPVLRYLGIGASLVTDQDPDSRKSTGEKTTVWGVDVELPLIKSNMLKMILYADHANIASYGSGQAVGLGTDFSALFGLLNLSVNIERRYLGKEFIGSYYGPFYEILRYTTISELADFYESLGGDAENIPEKYLPITEDVRVTQEALLPMMNKKRQGWYAGLYVDLIHIVQALGSFEMMDNVDNSGILHVGAGLSRSIPLVDIDASYDKRGIGTFKDIRTLDYRSVARVGIGYKLKPYLLLYLDYIWNFVWDEENQNYKPQERFQPRLAFRYSF